MLVFFSFHQSRSLSAQPISAQLEATNSRPHDSAPYYAAAEITRHLIDRLTLLIGEQNHVGLFSGFQCESFFTEYLDISICYASITPQLHSPPSMQLSRFVRWRVSD